MEQPVEQPDRLRLAVVLSVGVLAASCAAVFILLAGEVPGVVVALYRMLIASLVMLPWTLRALRRTPLTSSNLPYTLGAGVFLGAHFAFWISSLAYTTVAASATLVASNPLWVALFVWLLLDRPPSFAVLLGIVVAVLGGALIGFADFAGESTSLGNAMALAGAVCFSAYLLLGRSAQRRGLNLQAYVGVAYGVAALTLLPLPLVLGLPYTAYAPLSFVWVALLALVPQLIGHTSFNYAVKHIDPTLVATVALLEPVGSSLLALLLFPETQVPARLTALGAAILLFGVILVARNSRAS